MDKPTTPGGGNSSGFPWPEDSGSETGFGATGAFGILTGPEVTEKPAPAPAIKPEPEKPRPPRTTGQYPAFGGKPLEEPVVHKVVFGGAEEGSAELLDRIRMAASGERPAYKEKAPVGQPGVQGNSGFTQLLRSLGGESQASTPVAKPTPVAEPPKPAPISGFTSLLQTLNAPDPKAAAAAPIVKPIQVDVRAPVPEPPKAPPPSAAPVDSTQGSFTEYLEALAAQGRGSSSAPPKPPVQSPVPTAAPVPPSSAASAPGSFTQLFGTFENPQSSAPAPAVSGPAVRDAGQGNAPSPAATPAQAAGSAPGSFTMLFGTLGGAEASSPAAGGAPERLSGFGEMPQGAASPTPPPASAPGSFTQLFGTFAGPEPSSPAPSSPAGRLPGFGEAPMGAATPENKPGAFTQMFGTFESAEASAPAPVRVEREPAYPAAGGIGSFTRMLSLEQESAAPVLREERSPLPGPVDYGLTPETAGARGPVAPDRDPFSEPLPELTPAAPSTPASSGVGITQLIRMLEEPATPSAAPAPVAPVVSPGGGPGIWTQTFASLSESSAAPASAATPSWAPPPAPAVVPAAPPVSAGTPAGPSEFTRILDASRMREMAMKGGLAEGAVAGATPASPAAPGFQMPSFAAPPPPPPPAMPAMRGVPPAPPPPPAAPAFPMNFAAPPVPQPPAVKPPAPPAVGKLQQMVPLLLVMVIVLLVALLVTVIFLMKH